MCLCWELRNQLSSQQSVDVIPLLCVDVRPVDVIPLFVFLDLKKVLSIIACFELLSKFEEKHLKPSITFCVKFFE